MRSPNRVALDLPHLRAVRRGLAARALAAAALLVGLAALAGPVRADREPFARTGTPPRYARDRTVDVLHQALDVRLDFEAGSIAGTATIDFAPLNDGTSRLTLDAAEMTITSVRLVRPEPAVELAFRHDGGDLHIELGEPRAAGRELTVQVGYEATPRKGLYFVRPDEDYPDKPVQAWTQGEDEDSQFWFPCWDYPNDKATFECRVSVPKPFRALSNGKLIAEGDDPDDAARSVFHWKIAIPQVTYLATLAAGDFSVIREDADGIPLEHWVQKGREDEARRSLKNTAHMMKFFNDFTGLRYPYEKYAQVFVADFIFGGMENTTATTLTDTTLHDERAALDNESDGLVAHELAHQWFGDLLTCRDWSHAWLNEGFATYFETLWREDFAGRDEALYDLRSTAGWYLGEDSGDYRRPIVTKLYEQSIDMFDGHLYGKGSLVLHALRGELGDALFRKAIRHYVKKHQREVVRTRDLIEAIAEATGRDLEWFFDQWVFAAGYPELEVSMSWDEAASAARVVCRQTQETTWGTPEVFRMSVPLLFRDGKGRETRIRMTVDSRETTFVVPLAAAPVLFRFDAGHTIFARKTEVEKPFGMWLEQLASDDDPIGRIEAAARLGDDGSAPAVAALRRGLFEDPFYGVRIACAEALGELGTDRARDILLDALASEDEKVRHPKARRAIVAALGELRDDARARAALTARLAAGEASYHVEAECARSLGKVGGEGVFEALVEALGRDSWRDTVRAGVVDGLAALEDPRAIEHLIPLTERGRDPDGRQAAISALAALGASLDEEGAEAEARGRVREHLEELLHDPGYRVARAAIGALETLGDPKARSALWAMVQRSVDGRMRRSAREAMDALYRDPNRSDELRRLRRELGEMQDEAKKLRGRVQDLEDRLGGSGAGVEGDARKGN